MTGGAWEWQQDKTILRAQDHIEEFLARFGSAPTLDDVLARNPDAVKEARAAEEDRARRDAPLRPAFRAARAFPRLEGSALHLPRKTTDPKTIEIEGDNDVTGVAVARRVAVKLKLSATLLLPVASPSFDTAGRRGDPPSSVGAGFTVKSFPVPYAKPPAWQRELKSIDCEVPSGATVDLGEFPVGARHRYLISPRVAAAGFMLPSTREVARDAGKARGWLVELSVRPNGYFVRAQWRLVADANSPAAGDAWCDVLSEYDLDEVGPFSRVFHLVYELRWDRGAAACFAARREIHNGRAKYGATGSWEGAVAGSTEGNNRGEFIDRYKLALHGAVDRSEWCGTFVGYCLFQAGFDLSSPLSVAKLFDNRRQIFTAVMKVNQYLKMRGRSLVFPHRGAEENRRWLREELKAWAPQRGDLLLVRRTVNGESRVGHIALVAAWDEGTSTLYVYEGNAFDKAKDSAYVLSAADIYAKCHAIGRIEEGEFARGPEEELAKVLVAGTDGHEAEFARERAAVVTAKDRHS